jgi:general secretion pathway protein L
MLFRAGQARALGVILSLDSSGPRLIEERRSGVRRSKLTNLAEGQEVWEVLPEIAQSRNTTEIRLRLPYSSCFARHVTLPEAVRHEAGRYLKLDLERSTPFRLKDVYWTYFVDAARSIGKTLTVCQLIVRRDAVETVLRDVRSSGLTVAGLDCWNEQGDDALPVNFIPQQVPNIDRSASQTSKILTALAAALTVSAVGIDYQLHQNALLSLKSQTGELQLKEARRPINFIQDQINSIQRLKHQQIPVVVALEKLTALLPDTVWLTNFSIEGNRISIAGEAQSAAPLISILENSENFANATFSSPVTREAKADRERFSIELSLRQGTGGGEQGQDNSP